MRDMIRQSYSIVAAPEHGCGGPPPEGAGAVRAHRSGRRASQAVSYNSVLCVAAKSWAGRRPHGPSGATHTHPFRIDGARRRESIHLCTSIFLASAAPSWAVSPYSHARRATR
ncbi:hypothetical protein F01_360053 [Burkholderia cenocepacia]|nr:hypothetical protein F01_360053 [Burkholderia cenocepacia]